MDIKETENILNKKFKKSIFSGYDTLDVDQFFDNVIEYIKNISIENRNLLDKNTQLESEYNTAHNQVATLQHKNAELAKKIKEYEANGYKKVIANSEKQKSRQNGDK